MFFFFIKKMKLFWSEVYDLFDFIGFDFSVLSSSFERFGFGFLFFEII